MDNKALLVVDPQIDFITGSLPVPGAEQAMDKLAEYIKENGAEYTHVIVTADRHPLTHCSFTQNGGEWPRHCVADSVGAAIWPAIMETLYDYPGKLTVLHKGENPEIEEYSIFKNTGGAKKLRTMVEDEKIMEIDICGLAGDVCVANTLKDAVSELKNVSFNILLQFSPSLDGGKVLSSLASGLGINH